MKIERRRISEMRDDFDVERRLWDAERKIKLQKDELEEEKIQLQKMKAELEEERERFREEMGRREVELKEAVKLERAKRAKLMKEILDIVRKHPEYGAKRISDTLQQLHFVSRNPSTIYAKLKRADLNTREKRSRYAEGEMKNAEAQPRD